MQLQRILCFYYKLGVFVSAIQLVVQYQVEKAKFDLTKTEPKQYKINLKINLKNTPTRYIMNIKNELFEIDPIRSDPTPYNPLNVAKRRSKGYMGLTLNPFDVTLDSMRRL